MRPETPRWTLALGAWLLGCAPGAPRNGDGAVHDASARFPVVVHRPPSLSSIEVDSDAGRVAIPCENCHSLFRENPPALPARVEELRGPHAGMRFAHGAVPCASCHERTDATRLHLATGEVLPMTEAMSLCRQCHGPQARDYDHGSHGGMRGYWDRSRGPRARNHCVDCHDPHAPHFPRFQPMPPPRDTAWLRSAPHG
ncbi:MAG: hypothetical protein HY909_09800 [Deltaproteobacteria bacterium]|nr:hypothetical protein [Deltaproteobacteria bacterium]